MLVTVVGISRVTFSEHISEAHVARRNKLVSLRNFDMETGKMKTQKRSTPEKSKTSQRARSDSCDDSSQSADRLEVEDRVFQSRGKAVVICHHPETLALKGKCYVRCLKGSVDIMGFVIRCDAEKQSVYSPDTGSSLTIKTLESSSQMPSEEVQNIISETFSAKDEASQQAILKACGKTTKKKDNRTVVLLLEELNRGFFNFAPTLLPFRELFAAGSSKHALYPDVHVLDPKLGVGLYKTEERDVKCMKVSEDFVKIVDWITSRIAEDLPAPVIVVCGGRDVGKSTLNRYLVNSALNVTSEVSYLDCDLGQTEFTGPGCVSVTTVSGPILGPPFTHPRQPQCCCYLGVLTPQNDPCHYMECLSHVFHKYMDTEPKSPLIVNTMGWIEGIGLGLLADTLRLVKPDLVVKIDCEIPHRNLPDINFILDTAGWLKTIPGSTTVSSMRPTGQKRSVIRIDSMVARNPEGTDSYAPKNLRSLALLAQFGPLFDEHLPAPTNITSMVPYELPWDGVAVYVPHQALSPSQIMYSLNASVVGMCVIDEQHIVDSSVKQYPKFVEGKPICDCLGMAIIRGVDPEKKVFYLLTALKPEEFSKVNCLVRGIVSIPHPLFMKQSSESDRPYVGQPKDVVGASGVSRRRHIQRR